MKSILYINFTEIPTKSLLDHWNIQPNSNDLIFDLNNTTSFNGKCFDSVIILPSLNEPVICDKIRINNLLEVIFNRFTLSYIKEAQNE